MGKLYDVAVAGATGLVGKTVLKVLKQRDFPIGKLYLLAGDSGGRVIEFNGTEYPVIPLSGETVIKNRVDMAFFCVEGEISKKFAPLFSALGTVVIDNSSAYRMEESVPLVIPSVNASDALMNNGIIANPNCSTIIAVSALAPLHKKYGVKRIVYNSYQAVSGAGQKGIDDLAQNTSLAFPCPIQNNIIPQIGEILHNGYTAEEQKMIDETKKILRDSNIAVTATCVRVPVFYGHGISINVVLSYSASLTDVTNTLNDARIKLTDCPTPLDCQGKDEVFAGRVRRDFSHPNTFNLWVISDNVLKGAALNAVQIAELLI